MENEKKETENIEDIEIEDLIVDDFCIATKVAEITKKDQ